MHTLDAQTLSSFEFIRDAGTRGILRWVPDTMRLLDVYHVGIMRACEEGEMVRLVHEARAGLGEPVGEDLAGELQSADEIAELARSERASSCRLLNAHVLVGAWGVLESAIDDVARSLIQHRPDCIVSDPRVRIHASRVASRDEAERAEALLEAMLQARDRPLGKGARRFESILEVVGLQGLVHPKLRDVLYEMHLVRNHYAHTNGLADSSFLRDCPWFHLALGDPVPVSVSQMHAYMNAMIFYAHLVETRAWARVGIRRITALDGYAWDSDFDVTAASALVHQQIEERANFIGSRIASTWDG